MNVLITGGSGFIGSSLAILLSSKNYKVIIYDININNTFHINHKNISFVYGDTNDKNKLYKLIKLNNFDGIIHLAAISRVVVAENNQEECIRTNVYGTKTLIEVLEKKRLE